MTATDVSSADAPVQALLDVRAVAALLGCSTRHVYRLVDGGRMPAPVRLGALVRWRRADVREWIDGGCKAVRGRWHAGRAAQRPGPRPGRPT